jgi:glycosyltransferase involved in cell wall biosynthesis
MNNQPKISVVIPTYNQQMYLKEAIDSVLSQTFRDFELIIVNDGSTDDTEKIILSYSDPRIKYIKKEKNEGIGEALNSGFAIASAKYETWQSSDNGFYPKALEELYKFLEGNISVDYAYANCDYIYTEEDGITVKLKKNINNVYGLTQHWQPEKLLFEGGYNLGVVFLWRKELRLLAGGSFYSGICEDLEFTVRATLNGGIYAYLDKCLGYYRYHPKINYKKLQDSELKQLFVDMKTIAQKTLEITDKNEAVETRSYILNLYGGLLGRSCSADNEKNFFNLKEQLITLLRKYKIKKIIDIGCGDMLWMLDILNSYDGEYLGVDIVKPLINRNKTRFGTDKINFKHLNILKDTVSESADLVICSNLFENMTYDEMRKAWDNIQKIDFKFLLLSTSDSTEESKTTELPNTYKNKTINLELQPFNFPTPIEKLVGLDSNLALWGAPDKWMLKKIPKIAYFYWGNEHLPFLQYMTLYSFCKYNPDWEIVLYTPKKLVKEKSWKTYHHNYTLDSHKNYWDKIRNLPIKVKIFDMETIQQSNALSEVHKSDILRAYLLYTYGGVWVDMDILFFKPMTSLYLNSKEYIELDCTISTYYNLAAIGFQLSSAKNELYKNIYDKIMSVKDKSTYECYGSELLSPILRPEQIANKYKNLKIENLKIDVVYSYFREYQRDIFASEKERFTNDSIGLHWFAGAPHIKNWINVITEHTYDKYSNVICNTIEKILKDKVFE